ncbi:YlbL family protein [Actinacidiphila guanduensis]|jgi:PDZ domain-containing protein|uniref:endopeptidase La n=1 Tax=Actinacidiphila guanduensis TaxID=310781 RepID=A0A1G9ZZG2_9ACTN|nr:PDZ domain-containing protein [Actinacidiphila guanduensis]SDN25916.1 PDZ domain-containing protein [Actinacidiphila guanduensis]
MPRRTVTLLASSLVLIALLLVALLAPTPYAEMSPGPTVNTLGTYGGAKVIQITGRQTYPTTGHLNMTTVRVTGADYHMNLVESVLGWLRHDDKVVEHDTLYPKGQTAEQADQQNAEEFSQSQDSAKVAALEELKIPVQSRVIVAAVVKGGAAEGVLHAGDVVKSVDGHTVSAADQVATFVTKHQPGQPVTFTVVRAADTKKKNPPTHQVTITTRTSDDTGPKRAVVGIQAGVEHLFPFTIDIRLADVGGPSAGMMFALGIIDELTPGSLTGGQFVAGTGTIDDNGNVGPIGGISLKTIGARDKGAKFFLTPADNCEEAAKDVPGGLTLVKVKTLDDAMAALKDIRAGHLSALPSCTK